MLFLASAVQTFAIEGLQLSLQCSNVVLSWPSVEGDTYIVQYRPTLDVSTPWQTLTSALPADVGTNLTFFTHSNIVQYPNCGGSSGSFAAMVGGGNDPMSLNDSGLGVPLARRADGTSAPVPLAIYPPGFDLSGFLIFDPATSEWVAGSGYSVSGLASAGPQLDGLEPPSGGSGGGGTNSASGPETGFYQVVQDGVKVLDSSITNLTAPAVVSGIISIAFEAGNSVGILQEVSALVDGTRYRGVDPLIGPPFSPGGLTVDTAFLENGDHTFQLEAGWLNPDVGDFNNFMFHRQSDQFVLTVSNNIYYPEWVDQV
jgi:hypothetical protein